MKKTMPMLLVALLSVSCGGREFSPPIAVMLAVRDDVAPVSACLEEFARLAAERSRRTLLVTLAWAKAPVDERAVLKSVREGGLDLACVAARELSALDPAYDAFALPFLFTDDAHFRRVVEGPIGSDLLSHLEKDGLTGLGFFDQGTLRFMSRDKKLTDPDDFGQRRFRVPVHPVLRRAVERLGGFTVPVPEEQAANALRLGLVDAAADFPWAFEARGYRPVVRRISSVGFARSPFVLVMSRSTSRHIPDAAVDFLRRAARDAAAKAYEEIGSMELVAEDGIVVDAHADAAAFAPAAEAVYREQSEPVRRVADRIREAR